MRPSFIYLVFFNFLYLDSMRGYISHTFKLIQRSMDYSKLEPNQTILVLNASYEPLNFTNWRRAVVLLIKNKAQALGKRVIRLVNYIKIPYKKIMQNKPSRAMIYKRDGHKCQYCGSTRNLTIDHIFPTSKGGDNSWENLVVACMPCNTRKGDKLLEETNLILETTPKKPFNKMLFSLDRADVDEWKKYSYN